ncbi:MAG: cysteine desulfurase [Leptospira sp.]|nr:cysteine desulfurase [Leptospira sp.]
MQNFSPTTYLDYNATTPVRDEIIQAYPEYLREFGNPSSIHARGRSAKNALENARKIILQSLGLDAADFSYKLVFTSSGTEANRLALQPFWNNPQGKILAIADIEHPCLRSQIPELEKLGVTIRKIPVLNNGQMDLEWMENDIQKCPWDLLVLQTANNETGIIQDLDAIFAFTQRHSIDWHTDAVQSLGKCKIDYKKYGFKSLTLSAHKLYAPKGTGAYIYRGKAEATFQGGGQESGIRPGTENLAGIFAFAQAVALLTQEEDELLAKQTHIQSILENRLNQNERVTIIGEDSPRLSNTTCFALSGMDNDQLLNALDKAGFQVSIGSACSAGSWDPSKTLLTMGVDRDQARSSLRVSLGKYTTEDDVIRFCESLEDYISKQDSQSSATKQSVAVGV